MMKDRAVQIRFIREPALPRTPTQQKEEPSQWSPEIVNAMIQDQLHSIIMTVGTVYVMKVAVDTLSAFILKKTKTKDNRVAKKT